MLLVPKHFVVSLNLQGFGRGASQALRRELSRWRVHLQHQDPVSTKAMIQSVTRETWQCQLASQDRGLVLEGSEESLEGSEKRVRCPKGREWISRESFFQANFSFDVRRSLLPWAFVIFSLSYDAAGTGVRQNLGMWHVQAKSFSTRVTKVASRTVLEG